jgi:prepilin-type N-terminal cleavage/methylation domain-containing protein
VGVISKLQRSELLSLKSCGFTLIEVLIAILIAGLGFLALSGMVTTATGSTIEQTNRVRSVHVLRRILSAFELVQSDNQQPKSGVGTPTEVYQILTGDRNTVFLPQDDQVFRTDFVIQSLEIYTVKLLKIRVTVSWGETPQQANSVDYVYPFGLKNS